MSINIEDLEDLGICKLGHQKRLMLGIKKAKLSRRRTTNFEEQGRQSICKSQFEGLEGTRHRDSMLTQSPRLHLRSSSLSAGGPLSPPPLSERKKALTPRPPPSSPKSTPGRPSSKPPAPPVSSCRSVFHSSAFGKVESTKLQTTSKSHFEEFFENDSCENPENKARPCQRTPGEGIGIVSVSNCGISKSYGVKPAGLRVSQPVLWSSTLGCKQRRTAAVGKATTAEKLENLETVGGHRDIKATEEKVGGSSKKFWNPTQMIGKHQQAVKSAAPKNKEEAKTNLRALVQNYGDWIKERGMVDLHTPKAKGWQERSAAWEDGKSVEQAPAKMQPQVVVSQPIGWPIKRSQDTTFGNPCSYETWKDPPNRESIESSPSHAMFSCDNSTEESLLTPSGDHEHQNGLRMFQRLRDTTRPLSWMTAGQLQSCSPPASPSPPPYPREEDEEEELADGSCHLKAPVRPARPVARVSALHVNHQKFFQPPLPSPVPQANKQIATDHNAG